MELSGLLDFIKLTHTFQQTKRSIYATGEDRLEHDAEHSYQLAIVAWYIIESQKLSLDRDKVIKYALVHDLPEVYAGDTPNFGAGVEMKVDKKEREEKTLEKLAIDFPHFQSAFDLIHAYEERADEESQFVYALDKLISPLNIYLDKGASWFKNNVTIEEMIANKRHRIVHPEILALFDTLVEQLRLEEAALFPQK